MTQSENQQYIIMKAKILEIINEVRENNGMGRLDAVSVNDSLRDDIGLNSFDLAELTVKIEDATGVDVFEDGVIDTVGQLYQRLGIA